MATYKRGINGPVSGKIGSAIGASWRGIDYLRSLPDITKPPTEKQLNQRLLFALVNGWLKPLRKLIWIGYQIFTGTKTPMNGCVSFHMTKAVSGQAPNYEIDFAQVVLSRGELLISFIKEVLCLLGAILNIKWDDVTASAFCSDNDKATFIVYNPAKEKFITFEGITERQAKEVNLRLPADFAGDVVHGWMSYVNTKGDAVSTSVYLGEVVVS